MIQVFRILVGVALAAVLIFSKWRMLKKLWSKDLGVGEIQILFDKDSK